MLLIIIIIIQCALNYYDVIIIRDMVYTSHVIIIIIYI